MSCLKSTVVRSALFVLLFSTTASIPALAWDTKVYVRNCDTGTGASEGFHAYNGGDIMCWINATYKEIDFKKGGELECDETGTGKCKIGVFSTHKNCYDKVSVNSGYTLLVYDVSGSEMETLTVSSSDANCCASTSDVTDGVCEEYLGECSDKNISGSDCLTSYVPCRVGGKDAAACAD